MSVSVEEQVRFLGRALEQYVDDVDIDEVMRPTQTESMVSVPTVGDSRAFVNGVSHVGRVSSRSVRGTSATPTARVPRRMMLIAVCVVVLVGVAGVLTVVQRPVESPVAPARVSPPPAWYQALAPFLPAGFEHVAIQQSNASFVQFEAFDPASSKTLMITVSRIAMSPDPSGSMTLAEARGEAWTDSGDHNISLPDGRQIGLSCGFRPMPDTEPGCPDVNGDSTDPDVLRSVALALATDFAPEDLPPASDELDHVPVASIRAAIGDISTPAESGGLEAPHYSFSFVQHGDLTAPDFFTVRTVTGFYPPLPLDTPRTSASANEYRLTWQAIGDDAVWYVSDNPTHGVDIANEILDRAAANPISAVVAAQSDLNDGAFDDPAATVVGALAAPVLPSGFELVYTVDTPVPFAIAMNPHGDRLEIAITSGPDALREVDRVEDELRLQLPEGRLAVGPQGQPDEHAAYLVTDDAIITATYTRIQDPTGIEPGSTVRIVRSIARDLPPELVTGLGARVGTAVFNEAAAALEALFDPVSSSGGVIRVTGAPTIEVSGDFTYDDASQTAIVRVELFYGQLAPSWLAGPNRPDAPNQHVSRVERWLVIVTVDADETEQQLAADAAQAIFNAITSGVYAGAAVDEG